MSIYDKATDDELDSILADLVFDAVKEQGASSIMGIPGVYEALKEHFNNDMLDSWARGYTESCSTCGNQERNDACVYDELGSPFCSDACRLAAEAEEAAKRG